MKSNRHISIQHPTEHRKYDIGDKVRVYSSWFNHNDALEGWYQEGIVEIIEPGSIKGFWVMYRITKVVCNGKSIPHSWKIGRLADFSSDCGFVLLLQKCKQPEMILQTSKPVWA